MSFLHDIICAIRQKCRLDFPGDDFTTYLNEQRDAAEESAKASQAEARALLAKQRAIDNAFFPPRGEKRDLHAD